MKLIKIFLLCIFSISYAYLNSSGITSGNYPTITHFEWGKIVIESHHYKDCRVWLNQHEDWNWNKTGTRHSPGIQIEDLSDFIDEVDIIILSEGVDGVLQIKPETITYLKEKNKEVHCLRTPKAVELYNKLAAEKRQVGALLHSTC